MNNNFFDTAERFPPVLVRLLARENGKAMTDVQIADRMGIQQCIMVRYLASHYSWNRRRVEQLRAFTCACHCDFTSRKDMNRIETYLRTNHGKPAFKYLVQSGEWPTYYMPLLTDWRKSMLTIPPALPTSIRNLLQQIWT